MPNITSLQQYLADEKMSFSEFARRINVAHATTVRRYAFGHRMPRPEIMDRIARETGGAVPPQSFYLSADQ